MNNGYETHKPSNRPPHQVAHAIPDLDAVFAVDIDDSLFDRLAIGQQRGDSDLLAIKLRSALR
jgi:hypothetical protein